ncbi:unnamed protein product [Darwinula stevensoni]|uniref:Uncharacterized protein n=1 Tax=Darwinula stevensoni TaxID=69355 RepID=A0A7R9A3A0_9CRUS|nr:unnamed protein product [Darwinula stevensoni]CAG0881671.1 unnamed protein product [Darwinula stevensoni]
MTTLDVFGRKIPQSYSDQDFHKDVTAFGRPGYGAPRRTVSGNLITSLRMDPAIRYNNETDYSYLERYERKSRTRMNAEKDEGTDQDGSFLSNPSPPTTSSPPQESPQYASTPPTEGATANGTGEETPRPITMESFESHSSNEIRPTRPRPQYLIHRRDLLEKLGWLDSNRDEWSVTRYREALQKHIADAIKRRKEEKERNRSEGSEDLASVLQTKKVGRPRRDPKTGELTNPLGSTDITDQRKVGSQEKGSYDFMKHDPALYRQSLREQEESKHLETKKRHEEDLAWSAKHTETWAGFWGRPGYGAPITGRSKRRNLWAMLAGIPPSTPTGPRAQSSSGSGNGQQVAAPRPPTSSIQLYSNRLQDGPRSRTFRFDPQGLGLKGKEEERGVRRYVVQIPNSRAENLYECDLKKPVTTKEFLTYVPFATIV